MTADIAFQSNDSENNPMLSKLTLSAAGITVFLAVLSLIFSSRLETLRVEYQDTIRTSSTTEANAIQSIQSELKSSRAELSATKQSLETEKALTDTLTKKIAAITQESEKIKADLALAQKTIVELRSAETSDETMASPPFSNSPISDVPSKEVTTDPDMESKGLPASPDAQSPISSAPIQESTDASLPEEPVDAPNLSKEPVGPSSSASEPSDRGTVPEPSQTP